ncbi:MAG TPA: hypothetical protein VMF29_07795 [Candidatus Edwardsbacteria bacterium]|nr:hypothetical protein [Candidatus Edwardsbacteria bacterium]
MKPNYAGAKRKKELERLKRQEEKALKKKERKEQKAQQPEAGGSEPVTQ